MKYMVTRTIETRGKSTIRELQTFAPTAEEAVAMFRAIEMAAAFDEVEGALQEIADEGEQ
jgi:hypothetical protein